MCHEFAHLLNEFLFCAIGVAVVLINDITFAIADDDIRNQFTAKCAAELAIGIEQNLVGPAVVVNERLYLVDILCAIDANSEKLNARLLLPFLVDLCNGVEFTIAGLTLRSKEIDNEGFAVIGERVNTDALATYVLQSDLWKTLSPKPASHRHE